MDLLIGNTYGKYIARDEDIPFMRHGFPILDRVGHPYFPTVGYKGAMRLLEKILGAAHGPSGPRCAGRALRTDHVVQPKTTEAPGDGRHPGESASGRCYRKGGDEPFQLDCGKQSAAGSVSQRACVFCGSRVVLYPIADALHLVHGPIGCAAYTWDIRGALSSGPATAPAQLLHRPAGDGRDLRRREEALRRPCAN